MAYASAARAGLNQQAASFRSSAITGLNQSLNLQVERALRARVQQESIKADTEEQRIQTVQWGLIAEKHRTQAAGWKAHAEGIKTQRAYTGYQIEQVGLTTDRVRLDIARVQLGKAQDQFAYEQADRYLGQLSYRATLTARAVDVNKLREQARHAQVIDGAPVPFFLAQSSQGAYGLPAVAGLGQVPMRRRVG